MKNLKKLLDKYIKKNYIKNNLELYSCEKCSTFSIEKNDVILSKNRVNKNSSIFFEKSLVGPKKVDDFIELIKDNETFSQYLLQLIDETGLKDSEIYNRVNMDRRLFSKIRSNKNYQPSKYTVFALIIALRLNYTKANKLLNKAGFNFSKNHLADIIIMFCLENNVFDIFIVNDLLVSHEQKALCLE